MNNQDVLNIALRQSGEDLCCGPEDFFRETPVLVRSAKNPKARKYLMLPFACNLVYYGGNVVASVSEAAEPVVGDFLGRFSPEYCFETPAIHVLDEGLRPLGLRTRHMAEYFYLI